jgi:hypothetical protein
MRIQVEYDSTGKIRSIAGVGIMEFSDESRGTMGRFPPKGDSSIIEVEMEDVRDERDIDGLKRVVSSYRVTGHPHEPRLTAESSA